jgi:hypothetical protein
VFDWSGCHQGGHGLNNLASGEENEALGKVWVYHRIREKLSVNTRGGKLYPVIYPTRDAQAGTV